MISRPATQKLGGVQNGEFAIRFLTSNHTCKKIKIKNSAYLPSITFAKPARGNISASHSDRAEPLDAHAAAPSPGTPRGGCAHAAIMQENVLVGPGDGKVMRVKLTGGDSVEADATRMIVEERRGATVRRGSGGGITGEGRREIGVAGVRNTEIKMADCTCSGFICEGNMKPDVRPYEGTSFQA